MYIYIYKCMFYWGCRLNLQRTYIFLISRPSLLDLLYNSRRPFCGRQAGSIYDGVVKYYIFSHPIKIKFFFLFSFFSAVSAVFSFQLGFIEKHEAVREN